jgi:hypothetical protein
MEDRLTCTLAAHAWMRVAIPDVAPLRKVPAPGATYPVSLLKNSDEQTVVVVAALLRAVARAGLPAEVYRAWGVLASPRFIGRDMIVQSVGDFVREGAWGVSPHVIPHRSLHSTSGTITLALDCRGPNYGIGGGAGGDVEGLLGAFSMVHERPVPGVWLALSRIDPILPTDQATGRPHADSFVEAVVLGLTRDGEGPRLTLELGDGGDELDLSALGRLLDHGGSVALGRVGRLTAA